MRNLDDIRATGVAWCTEEEFEQLFERIAAWQPIEQAPPDLLFALPTGPGLGESVLFCVTTVDGQQFVIMWSNERCRWKWWLRLPEIPG